MGQGVIQRELEGVTLGSSVGLLERNPAWEEVGRGTRALLYSALRAERIFRSSVLGRTVYCGILSGKVYKLGIIASQAYGDSLLASFSGKYGTPNTASGGRHIWDDGVTRLEWWTDMPINQVNVFLTDCELVVNGYGPKPWFRVFVALIKGNLMRQLAQILVRLPFPRLRRARPEMAPENWASVVLDELLSPERDQVRKQFYDDMNQEISAVSSVPEEFFVATILGAQLQLLGFVSVKTRSNLGMAVILASQDRLKTLPPAIQREAEAAYRYCNGKIVEYGLRGISGYRALADGCADILNLEGHPDFSARLEADFAALGDVWRLDIGRYSFSKWSPGVHA